MISSSTTTQVVQKRESTTSRKRALTCIGIGLVAAAAVATTPLLSTTTIGLVQASPFHQHRVGRAHREVTYQHIIERTKRRVPASGFWYPEVTISDDGEYLHDDDDVVHAGLLQLEDADPDHGVVWSIVADASRQHPPGAARLQRKQHHVTPTIRHDSLPSDQKLQQEQEQQQQPTAHNVYNSQTPRQGEGIRRRREQVTDKFVEDSTSAVLQEEGEAVTDVVNGEKNDQDAEGNRDYLGFNVTAQIQYNVSAVEDDDEEISVSVGTTSTVVTSSSKLPDNSSSAFESIYQPLRIRAILSEQRDGGDFLTLRGRQILLEDIMRPALLTWSAALRVEPVVGNLTVDERQLFDNQTCGPGMDSGLPSPRVPSSHLTDGIPDTDMILYLSIGFTPEALNMTRFVMANNQSLDTENSTTTANNATKKTSRTTVNNQRGGGGSQRALGWTSSGTNRANARDDDARDDDEAPPSPQLLLDPMVCSGDYVAAASYCSTDQFDRPTAGMLHICIDKDFFNRAVRARHIVTIMHEVGHSLGFNSRSMAHFRRPDGSPITPRVDGEIVETRVQCAGPSSRRRYANVALPSEEILQFRTVRGGVRVAEVVTPSVLQVVRNHFDCQNLSGAELESGEYSPLAGDPDEQACIGDHWERRLFQNDLMNPVVDSVEYSPFISTITMAYFADSGWYQVDLSMAQLAASWGRGAGCGFVEDTCIGEDGEVPPPNKPFFCNAIPKTSAKGLAEEIDGCTPDLSRKAACSLGQYATELPPEYQYFGLTYGGTVGGSDAFIDYCPTYTGFANGLCSRSENAALLQVNHIERFGKRNSRCLSGVVKAGPTALCLQIACVVEDRSLHVKIDGTWRLCGSKEQELKVFEDDYVVCPDPRRVCPTFYCHHDCLGTSGRCDYNTGTCVCSKLNQTNVTAGATGAKLNNATGICEPKNSFAADIITDQALSVMPHADSPLSDYYVDKMDSLQNDRPRLLRDWQVIVLTIITIIVVSIIYWCIYFRLNDGGRHSGTGGSDDNNSPGVSPNPNKDKMIATVLVDMRMNTNGSDGASVAPTNETSASLCGLESAASAVSSLCPSFLDNDDRSSLASEDVLEDVDVLDSKPKCIMRKRRFKGHVF